MRLSNPILTVAAGHLRDRSGAAFELSSPPSKSRGRLKARVEYNEIYLQENHGAPRRCTRWHICVSNTGLRTLTLTGWKLVTYRSLLKRILRQPTVLGSATESLIRIVPSNPDSVPELAPGRSHPVFVVTEPDIALVHECPVFLRIDYAGGTEYVRVRYLL